MSDHTHIHPAGVVFELSTDGESYAQVFELQSVEGAKMSRGESSDTTLNSPNKFLIDTPGWKKGGDVALKVYVYKTLTALLLGYWSDGTDLYGRCIFPLIDAEAAGSQWDFQCWIKDFPMFSKAEKGSDEKLAHEITLHLTTEPEFTEGE